ncbi:MAG TPA: DNA methyltransferase [Acetobacteraceae bacterium]
MIRMLHGDCRDVLPTLEANSVHCVVTSPPYFGLRDYGTGTWEGGDAACDHAFDRTLGGRASTLQGGKATQIAASVYRECSCGARRIDQQIGLEASPDAYLATMVAVFREVRRVLRPDGVCWVNVGDSFSSGNSGQRVRNSNGGMSSGDGDRTQANTSANPGRAADRTLAPKQLMMMPARLAIALQADGWWLRSMLPWCLSGGTRVYVRCQKGEMPMTIKDMVRLDPTTVQLWNGERWTQAVGWWKTERPDKTYEIELRSGQRIGCTAEHVWPVEPAGNIRADELKVGDVIRTCQLPEPPTPKAPSALDDEMIGWFVGLYIAEGSRFEREIHIASHVKEEGRFARLRALADAFHGSMTLFKKTENSTNVTLHGPILHGIIDTYVSGRVASDKHLGPRCWQRSNAFLRAVLDGYLSGDGHWDEQNRRWRLGFCNNDELVADLRTICARLNVTIRLRRVMHKLNGDLFPGYRGEIRFDRAPQLEGMGRFPAKDDGEIVEIRESRARQFWDIEVADEPHLFALASGVLTHNCKRSAMPESVTDRPASAVEYVFLLTKSARYFWDGEAVRRGAEYGRREGTNWKRPRESDPDDKRRDAPATVSGGDGGSRNMRNSDLFYDSLEDAPEPAPRTERRAFRTGRAYVTNPDAVAQREWPQREAPEPLGLICDDAGSPLALDVNPAAFSAAHFASFPPRLVEPLIRAGTSERGCCAQCGAPWRRTVERTAMVIDRSERTHSMGRTRASGTMLEPPTCTTTGWSPGCAHDAAIVPATILDPFAGAGTTLLVADRLQRDAIGIELNPAYGAMADARVVDDAPLLAWGAAQLEAAE